jgi:Fe2+ or Zn2+ uptake regulation protein
MSTTFEDELRSAGLRATGGRLAVLKALEDAPHTDAESLYAIVSSILPGIPKQSIYNALNDLTGKGLVRRVEPAGSAALYERRLGDNHHHIVCRSCGKIADVDCVVGEAPCLQPSSVDGFSLETAEVTFWGLCDDCRTAKVAA